MLTKDQRRILERHLRKIRQKGKRPARLTHAQAQTIAASTGIDLRSIEWLALDRGILPLRYAANVGTFTLAGQKKLLASRVLVVGLGGLGGYVVEQLARAGTGHIFAVDPDVFDETNLNRQVFCTVAALGKKKVTQARTRVRQINPAVEFSGRDVKFQQLPEEALRKVDLAFDCLDNVDERPALEERCSSAGVPLVHGAIAGWYGQVGVSWPGKGMLQRVYKGRSGGIERKLGNPPFTPAMAASLMVAQGIKVLLGKASPGDLRLHFFDLLDDEWETIRWD